MAKEICIRLDCKEAKKVLAALEKGTYEKLTRAQADAIADFICEFQFQTMEAGG